VTKASTVHATRLAGFPGLLMLVPCNNGAEHLSRSSVYNCIQSNQSARAGDEARPPIPTSTRHPSTRASHEAQAFYPRQPMRWNCKCLTGLTFSSMVTGEKKRYEMQGCDLIGNIVLSHDKGYPYTASYGSSLVGDGTEYLNNGCISATILYLTIRLASAPPSRRHYATASSATYCHLQSSSKHVESRENCQQHHQCR
jgi:hypothetical protein